MEEELWKILGLPVNRTKNITCEKMMQNVRYFNRTGKNSGIVL